MDSLRPEVASVFRTVITGDREQIRQAIYNFMGPGGRYYLFQEKDSDGRNLLHYACMYNTDEVAIWMLSLRDADQGGKGIPYLSDKFGATAAMYAASTGKVKFVQELIKFCVDVKCVDIRGMSIIDYCLGSVETFPSQSGSAWDNKKDKIDQIKEVVNILINKGVKSTRLEGTGMSPEQYIDKYWFFGDVYNPINIRKEILESVTKSGKPIEVFGGQTHLCVAVCFMQNYKLDNNQRIEKFVKMFISRSLNINETDERGMTALHHLCYYKYDFEPYGLREVFVAKLLDLGADPNIKDIRGYTPLMCALEKGFALKYDPLGPRSENEKGIGKLLKANEETYLELNLNTQSAEMQVMFSKQSEGLAHNLKTQEASFKQEIKTINEKFTEEIALLKSLKYSLETEIISLKASKDAIESKYVILEENLRQQNQDADKLKSIIVTLQATNSELHQKLEEKCQEMVKLKSNIEDLYKVNSELKQKQDDGTKIIDDLKIEITALQVLDNTHNEMQHKIEEQLKDINDLKLQVEELEKEIKEYTTISSLLLGNVSLADVCRHLQAAVEVICLPDASLEDLEATISKDNQKYKNIYLVTGGVCDGNDVQNLIAQYREIINAAKNKSKELIVSSILPTLENKEVNAKVELVNKSLQDICQDTGCEFVNNDSTFKYRDGTVNEACFDEEGENLSEFGIKRLLKNLRLFTAKKTQLVTNI